MAKTRNINAALKAEMDKNTAEHLNEVVRAINNDPSSGAGPLPLGELEKAFRILIRKHGSLSAGIYKAVITNTSNATR